MKISVIIACFNEGPDLEATVALARAAEPEPHEIIVVDDCSDEPVEPRLTWSGAHVIRTAERLGAGLTKRVGADAATGEAIVILDSHMRMDKCFTRDVARAVELFPSAVLCSASQGFRQKGGTWEGSGARIGRRGDSFALGRHWLKRRDDGVIDQCPCVFGACYFMSTATWTALAGLNPNFYGWGYEEQDLSLRAWLVGREVRRHNGLVVQHNYDRHLHVPGSPRLNSLWLSQYNGMVTTATLFEDGVYERLYEPFFKMIAGREAVELFDENRESIMTFRDYVQSERVLSDSDLESIIGFRLPTLAEQQEDADRLLQRRARGRRKA